MGIDKETIQKEIENMRKKQGFIDSMIEQTEDHILVVDKDYRVLALNALHQNEFKRRYNKTLNVGDNVLDFLEDFPNSKARMKELLGSALCGLKTVVDKYKSIEINDDGNSIYYQMQQLPIRSVGNEVIGAALMYRDITNRVITDEKIEYIIRHTANLTEEEFFNDLTLQMHKMFGANHIYVGLLNNIANTIATRAYRINGKKVPNLTYDIENTPDQVVIETGSVQRFEAVQELFRKDSKLLKWNANSYKGIPVFSPTTGASLGIFVMINDSPLTKFPNSDYLFNVIALRAGAEIESIHNLAALKAHDKQLLDITHNVPEVIYEYITGENAKNNRFTFVSRAAEEIYETSIKELYENPQVVWKSIHPDDHDEFVKGIDECSKELKTFHWTGRLVGRNSYKLRWVKITAKPQKLGANQLKWHGVIDDISRIKYIEQELIYAKKLAEESAASKEDFLAIMSHEIRTPLNGIVGITDIMIEEATPDQMEYLNMLKFSAENLMTLINNILDFSKLNAGKIEISQAPVYLKLLLKNLKHAHSFRAKENGNELHFVVDQQIPDIILGDDMVLLQILNNLIGNAVKFTRSGKVELVLNMVEQTPEEVTINFEVNDTGIGISNEDMNVIFDKFQQLGDKNQQAGGTGLGLGIAKMLITALKSDLKVKSTLGEGTSFFFKVTFKKSLTDSLKESHANKQFSKPAYTKNIKLLLVEDVEENKEMLVRFLDKSGNFTVETASNGIEAIEAIQENTYDIVLMDLRMPLMNGREATAVVRGWSEPQYKSLPIVALTADNFDINSERNFTDVIHKPFSPRELEAKIISIVSKTKF